MKRLLYFLTFGLLISYFSVSAIGGEYSSDFEQYLADSQSKEMIGAVITMVDQVDLEALKAELYARHANRREWHETVVLALQEKATITQSGIMAELADLKSQGMIEDYRGLWVGNVVLVTASREALDILVSRNDVLMINPDYPIENIEPVSKGGDSPIIAGVENGLRAIRADEVWAMGFTGEGRLVSHLDTGVDGNHPALNARWRGYDPRYDGHPEWAWFDSISHTQFPQDWGSHGTHTMGTICGLGENTGDTIGVAFGAQWISAGVIDRQSIPRTVGDALGAFQWIADPDGDPGTVWDVPDACSNSWGLTTGHGYPHCDEVFWVVLDGCEAAGVFVVFAAGNEGPGQRTLRNPATRASTDIKSFAIGALDGNDPNLPIAGFSSRGPTECTPDGNDTIKPEVSAPGVNVRSSVPGGGYAGGWSGTSMACPHVAGVVALMREANPNLTTDQIGEILLETATDLGQEGEDNAYGMGIVDAYEAVIMALAYLEGWGTLAGVITDQATGDPIQGALVSVIDRPWSATSGGDGSYRLFMPADTLFNLKIENPPTHLPIFDQQMVAESETLYVDYALEGKVMVTLMASFANPEDASYRSFFLKGSWDNDGFYDENWSGDYITINDDGEAPDEFAEDGIFTGSVMLARDEVNTYSWAIYSENYGGEDARLDDGADFDIPDLNSPDVPILEVNPSGSDNNWIISVEGDNGLSLDLMQGIDNTPTKWGAATALNEGVTYTFRFHVMHSEVASYGSGGIGGPDLTFTPEVDGSYDFIFNDLDDSYVVQLTGTEGPPTYLSAQSGLDGHIPVGWLPPGTVESQEMAYDDGQLVNGYYYFAYDNLMATMFVPLSHPLFIDSVIIHVLTDGDPYWPWPDATHDPVGISIFLDNGSGYPENDPVFYTEAVGEPGEWIRVDVDEILVADGNFWVAMNNLAGGGEEGMGLDAYTDYPANKWAREDGNWGMQDIYTGDHMIRAKVFGGGAYAWIGYDSSPAGILNPDVPILTGASKTAGISSPSELKTAVDSRMVFDRMAYHPNVSRVHPPMGLDTQVLAGYNLYRDIDPSPFDRDLMINSELIEVTNYDDWGDDPYGPIVNGVTYYYQASAVYDIGEGQFVEVGPSNEATGTAENHPPADPENLVGYSIGQTVYLDWSPNTDYDIAQYRIFRRDYGEQDFNLVGTVDHPDTSFTEELGIDGIYRYKIAAVDAEGVQSEGYSNNVDIPIGTIPPRQLTASTDQEFQIELNWRNPGLRPLDPLQNLNVAILISDYDNAEQEVVDFLLASGEVEAADFIDAQYSTPTLDDLEPYDLVVTWSNYVYSDPVGIGNLLADYIETGKGVVALEFAFYNGWAMQGRFMTEYSPYTQANSGYVDVSLGDYDPGHPLMDNVSNVTDYFVHDVSLTGVGEAVAWWSNGWPFVAYNTDNQMVVGINGYVGIPYRQWTGDMLQVLLNSVVFVAGGSGIEPAGYRVYKSDNPSGPFNDIAELPGNVRTYLDVPVPNGVDYYYFVTALYEGDEESDPSNVALGRGMNHPPEPPENLEAEVDDRDIIMTWTFDDIMGDLDHFNVYKKLVPDGEYELDGSTTETSYIITIPEGEDGTYLVVVTAVDDGDPQLESDYSQAAYVSVGNLPPVNLRGTSNQEDHVPLAWNEPGLRPTMTIIYDDSVLANGYYYFAYDAIMANHFEATSPVEVETLWVHVLTQGDEWWPWPDGNHDPVGISVWDDDGSGMPGDMAYYVETTCELGEWIMIPIEGGLTLDGPNFWIGLQNLEGSGEDGMGIDSYTDYPEHKWARVDGSWAPQDIYTGDHMIRATIIDSGGMMLHLTESAPSVELAMQQKKANPAMADLSVDKSIANGEKAPALLLGGRDTPRPLDILTILGYNIYRSESPDVPVDPDYRLNEEYIIETSYDDSAVVNGTTYYYVATAVYDNSGDIEESPPSNEVALTPMVGGRMVLDPTSFEVTGAPGEIVTEQLNISNPGGLDIDFTINTFTDLAVGEPVFRPNVTFQAKPSGDSEETDKPESAPQETYPPMILDSGGPDEFGYIWIDSDEPNGPEFDWIDISGIGNPLFMSDDDNQGLFYFDFEFPFYGQFFTGIRICSNGFLSFTSTSADWSNDPIPGPSSPENLIAPFWDDLAPHNGGMIYWYSDEEMFVVSWIDIPAYPWEPEIGPYTFEVILYPDGRIKYQYLDMNPPLASATIGIQDVSQTIGLQIAYDQPYVHNDLAVLISTGWLSADPASGTVPAGEDFNVSVIFDATLLEEGIYTGSLVVAGYDMNHMVGEITVPVTFYVELTGVSDEMVDLPKEFSLSQNYPNPFNPTTEIKFALPVNSHVTLEIFNVLGQKVVSLIDSDMEAGYKSINWDGTDNYGQSVSSGIYFYKLKAGDHTFTKKMMLLK